jgi:prophage regulatory protein
MDDLFDYAGRPAPARLATKPIDDELWSVRTIAAKTGLARSTIYAYVKQGLFPRQRRLGPGRVGGRASEVRIWIASR